MVLQRFKFDIHVYSFFLVISLLKISDAVFRFQCPVQSQWKHRAETFCDFGKSYFCLYDKNEKNFTEFCRDTEDFDAPGQKLIVAGSSKGTLQGTDCDSNFYQPFKFLSSGNSHCVYKKSYCSEEGQVVYSNGTEKNDRACRCDYTRGYDFITQPNHPCLCVPSKEDCSCYHKTCPTNYILSPDYECLNENEWKLSFNCDSISTVVLSKDPKISLSTDNSSLDYHVIAYRTAAHVAVLVIVILMLSVSLIFLVLPVLQDCLYRMKRKRTDLDTIPCDIDEQVFSLIANEKSILEKEIDAIDFEKKELKEKIIKLEENIGKVPNHVLELQEEILKNWTNKLSNKFVVTKAAESVYQCIKSEKVVAIIGPMGTGKSAYAYYAAFKLKENYDYVIVPTRQPSEITQYYLPDTKQVFIIDDFIGKYSFDEADAVSWEKEDPLLHKVLSSNDRTKVIITCRKSIWHPEKCERVVFSAFVCDLGTDELRLTLSETQTIVQSYIEKGDIKRLNDQIIMMYTFLPSLCSIFSSKTVGDVVRFFTLPVQFLEKEIDNYKMKSPERYMSLAVLAIEQKVSKKSVFDSIQNEELIKNLFGESGFQTLPSKRIVISHLAALTDTYVKVHNDTFEFIHETMQNIVLYCIAKTFLISVLKYCKSDVFKNQVRLACISEEQTVPAIKVISEHEEAYFTRLAKELCEGQYRDVFDNNQNAFAVFRKKWLVHLNKIRKEIPLRKNSDGMTVLHVVSSLGYDDFVYHFVKIDNLMVNKTDAKGNTPLHLASLSGHLNIVKCLVENGRNVHILNNDKLSPFFYACEKNQIPVVRYLISLEVNLVKINETYSTRENKSVLHIACIKGLNPLVQILLDHHATVDIQDKNGLTPLHLTCLNGQFATASLLITARANANALDILQRTPVYYACTANYKEIVKLLIQYKADINQSTSTGYTPLHAACENSSIEIVNILIKHHSNVNVKEKTVESPLHSACRAGNEHIVKLLIDHSASVNSMTKDEFTPFHEACIHGRQNVAHILLEYKANYKQGNKNGWTALLFSCVRGYNDIVKMLLNLEIDVNISNKDGITPLMLACKENKKNVVESLLVSNADVNQCNNFKSSALEYTCTAGNMDIVNLLLEHNVNINLANKNGITPLHTACMNDHEQVIKALIEKKANINSVDVLGETPLYKSCFKGNIEIVTILLNNGATINISDTSGKSPAAIAMEKGFNSIVELLNNANKHM